MQRRIEVVGAAIVHEQRVLAARKRSGPLAGLWEFPGGKVEDKESHAVALVREVQEELACSVLPHDELAVTEYRYAHAWIRLTTLHCSLLNGEPEAIEHEEVRWVDRNGLDRIDWAPADREAVAAVRVLLRSSRR